MLRRWSCVALFLAVAVLVLVADAGQGRERRLRRDRGYYDNGFYGYYNPVGYPVDSSVVVSDSAAPVVMYGGERRANYFPRERRLVRRNRGYYGNGSYGFYNPVGYPIDSSVVVSDSTPQFGMNGERRANYVSPDSPAGPARQMPVFLEVRVPPSAQILIEGQKTTQMGPRRLFVSPPLTPGRSYTYDIKATWMENGREVTRSRTLAVRPGERLNVDLLQPAPENRRPE